MATYDDINKIYQSNFGRPAEKAGVDYWMDQAAKNPGMDLNATIRGGAQSDDILARSDITTDKLDTSTTWGSDLDLGGLNKYDSVANKWVGVAKPVAAAPAPAWSNAQTNRQVDAPTETIEGRITGLLSANNPVIQQAGNRAMQQFQQRGLLNSSMAIQAANEAMTSKAIEIAGPDAKTYTDTGMLNQKENNVFAGREQQFGYDMQKQAADNAARGSLQTQQDAAALERQTAGNTNTLDNTQAVNAAKAKEASAQLYSDGYNTIEREYTSAVDAINNQSIPQDTKNDLIYKRRLLTNYTIDAWNASSRSLAGWSEQWAVLPVAPSDPEPTASTAGTKLVTNTFGSLNNGDH